MSQQEVPEAGGGPGRSPGVPKAASSLRLRHVGFVLLGYAVLFGGFGYSMFHDARRQLVSIAQDRIDGFRVVLGRQLSATEDSMRLALDLLADNEVVVRAFAERRREDLQASLLPLFEETLKPKYGITQFHYHLAPATSFLRLHQPKKFGDDISMWRRSIVRVNETGKPVGGVEVSKSGPGLKVVYPVISGGAQVGSVEMAVEYPALIRRVAGDFSLEYAVGIENGIFKEAHCEELLKPEVVNAGTTFSSFSAPLIRHVLDVAPLPESPEVLTTLGRTIVFAAVPIRDLDDRLVGRIALSLDVTADVRGLRKNLAVKLGLLLGAALLVSGATLGLLDRRHKREQLELTTRWANQLEEKNAALVESQRQLEARNLFIRSTFGRYLTDEIVQSLLEQPEGLKLGGEQRTVTIMMTDLRGFTSMSERLTPEEVVWILNQYLGSMTEIIKKHQGTIDEFIGDAIMVIFGAPLLRDDDATRAVRCAIEMQCEMSKINDQIRLRGLPEIEMGIGLNTGSVVVGNIGSASRAKYGVVGSPVNLTARIESYTTGSQVMISEATRQAVGAILQTGDVLDVKPKGVAEQIRIYEVVGLGGENPAFVPRVAVELEPLPTPFRLRFVALDGKHESAGMVDGELVQLSKNYADLTAATLPEPMANLKIDVGGGSGATVFAKVSATRPEGVTGCLLRFTSVPPEAWEILRRAFPTGADPSGSDPKSE